VSTADRRERRKKPKGNRERKGMGKEGRSNRRERRGTRRRE
jgi:hypothetical protein